MFKVEFENPSRKYVFGTSRGDSFFNMFAKKWVPKWNPLLGLSIEKKRGGGGRGGPNLTLSFAGEAASFLDLRKVIKILKLCY